MAKKNPFLGGWKDKTKANLKKYFSLKKAGKPAGNKPIKF